MRHKRTRPAVVCLFVGILMAVFGLQATSAFAASPIYSVMNTSEAPPDGVYFRNSAHTSDTDRVTGHGVYKGDRVRVSCYARGDKVGPYSNPLWYDVINLTRPTINGKANVGYLNAHYINDGLATNQVESGVPACGSQPKNSPCVFNIRWNKLTLTANYEGNHRYYGNAWQAVQDWNALNTGITISLSQSNTAGNITFTDVYWDDARKQVAGDTEIYVGGKYIGANPQPYSSVPSNPPTPSRAIISVNQYTMDTYFSGNDTARTKALVHELGHALGLAHATLCYPLTADATVMYPNISPNANWAAPRSYDKYELEELYKIPTG